MKIATLTCLGLGLLGALLAALTALGAVPGFVDFGLGLGDIVGMESVESIITTAFWGGLSVLLLLAAIAFGAIAKEEL
jgi:hypothetical protein